MTVTRLPQPCRHCLLALLLPALVLAAWLPGARAASEFQVLAAEARLADGVFLLDADIRWQLDERPLEALYNGVPLIFEVRMEIYRGRDYLWPEVVAELLQQSRLEYHSLTGRYLLTNMSTNQVESFRSLTAARRAMGKLRGFPLLDASLLDADGGYRLRLKPDLDIESLPAPLRPMAYLSSAWSVDSTWFDLPL